MAIRHKIVAGHMLKPPPTPQPLNPVSEVKVAAYTTMIFFTPPPIINTKNCPHPNPPTPPPPRKNKQLLPVRSLITYYTLQSGYVTLTRRCHQYSSSPCTTPESVSLIPSRKCGFCILIKHSTFFMAALISDNDSRRSLLYLKLFINPDSEKLLI